MSYFTLYIYPPNFKLWRSSQPSKSHPKFRRGKGVRKALKKSNILPLFFTLPEMILIVSTMYKEIIILLLNEERRLDRKLEDDII